MMNSRIGQPPSAVEAKQISLDEARRKAAETAAKLRDAPRASYPQPIYPTTQAPSLAPRAQEDAQAPAGQAKAAPAGAVAPAARPSTPMRPPAQAPAARSSTPGIDAVLAVTRRSRERAEGYAAAGREDAQAAAKRRAELQGKLRESAYALANPNASPLERDMARRGAR